MRLEHTTKINDQTMKIEIFLALKPPKIVSQYTVSPVSCFAIIVETGFEPFGQSNMHLISAKTSKEVYGVPKLKSTFIGLTV